MGRGIRITCFSIAFRTYIYYKELLSGAGDIRIPMIMGFIEVIVRVSLSKYLSGIIGFNGVFLATGLTWFATGIFGSIRVVSGKWKDKSIVSKRA